MRRFLGPVTVQSTVKSWEGEATEWVVEAVVEAVVMAATRDRSARNDPNRRHPGGRHTGHSN
jgi:hypothetical protein